MKHVVIVGGGFAGLNAAKQLGNKKDVRVTLIDRSNHHLFQPLIYQVAMAGLSPAEVAMPIRGILRPFTNIRVLMGEVTAVNAEAKTVTTDFGDVAYDYLVLACGARHSYFGHDEWEEYAPGLKTLAQATEIRKRVLKAFEEAEKTDNRELQRKHLTFVVVGGGPTGVELAGAIGEMSRYTLCKDFRNIDVTLSRIILIEAGSRILPSFSTKLTARATRDLEQLGVQVWTNSTVTGIDEHGVQVGSESITTSTVLWAAGVQASELGATVTIDRDRQGRVKVEPDLTVKGHPDIFIAGDMAHALHKEKPLPGVAPVAMQQGRYIGKTILHEIHGKARKPFSYLDKGQMATIGRSKAIVEFAGMKFTGFIAWVLWLLVHILYLTGFKNRFFVVVQWAWSYLSFRRGARLILEKTWKFGKSELKEPPV